MDLLYFLDRTLYKLNECCVSRDAIHYTDMIPTLAEVLQSCRYPNGAGQTGAYRPATCLGKS